MTNYLKGIEDGVIYMLTFFFLGLIISLFFAANPNYSSLTQYQSIFSIMPVLLGIFGLALGFSSSIKEEKEKSAQAQKT